jgi:hypothetical protein
MKTNVLYKYFEFIWKIFAWCFGIIGIANTISYSKEGSWQYWLLVLLCYFMFFGGLFLITDFYNKIMEEGAKMNLEEYAILLFVVLIAGWIILANI